MSLADHFHNRAVADQLTALLAGGKLVHAFLFIGGKDSRLQIGKELAKAILCESPAQGDSCGACVSCRKFDHGNHEDFLYLDLETAPGNAKTQIGVDAVELLQEQLKLKPFGARHAVLIEEAHLLNTAAQNKLLKTLEEPAGDSVIILLAEKKDALLPTVLSRCSTYYLEDEQTQPDEEMLALAKSFLAVCADSPLFYRRRDCIKPLFAAARSAARSLRRAAVRPDPGLGCVRRDKGEDGSAGDRPGGRSRRRGRALHPARL